MTEPWSPLSSFVHTMRESGTTSVYVPKNAIVFERSIDPRKEAADANGGAVDAAPEVHAQLDALLVTLVDVDAASTHEGSPRAPTRR